MWKKPSTDAADDEPGDSFRPLLVYALQLAGAGIAIGMVLLTISDQGWGRKILALVPLGDWAGRIVWFILTAAVAIVLARRRRLRIDDAFFGCIGAMVIALIGIGVIVIIGAAMALRGPFGW